MSRSVLPVRQDDPDTSIAAAQIAIPRAPIVRDVVLEIIREHGPLTHDQIIAEYHRRVVQEPDTPRASESGIRTRLSELRKEGLVVQSAEEGRSNFGNRAKLWQAADPAAAASADPVSGSGPVEPDDTASLGEDDIVRFTDADEED